MTALDCWYVPLVVLVLSWHYLLLCQIRSISLLCVLNKIFVFSKTNVLLSSVKSYIVYRMEPVNDYSNPPFFFSCWNVIVQRGIFASYYVCHELYSVFSLLCLTLVCKMNLIHPISVTKQRNGKAAVLSAWRWEVSRVPSHLLALHHHFHVHPFHTILPHVSCCENSINAALTSIMSSSSICIEFQSAEIQSAKFGPFTWAAGSNWMQIGELLKIRAKYREKKQSERVRGIRLSSGRLVKTKGYNGR